MDEIIALVKAHLELAQKIKKSIYEFGGNASDIQTLNLNSLMGKHYIEDVTSLLGIIEKLKEEKNVS